MISIEKARSGHPVLKKDGRYLGSSYDPIKEASSWVDQVLADSPGGEPFFVLGLGSGYHAEELARRVSAEKITVIENDPEVAAGALKLCRLIKAENLIVESRWSELPSHGRFSDFACGVFKVAAHGPSCQIDPVYYDRVDMLLNGREWTSFLLQLKMRPELFAAIDPNILEKLHEEPVTIKTLKKLFAGRPIMTREMTKERMIWRALEELIL